MFDEVPLEHEYHNLGNDCYRLGQYDKAIAHYTKALQLNSRMAETYFNRALAYARLGEYEAALADASQVITMNKSLHDAYYLRGRIWELCLDDQAAVADYEKALELNPSFKTAAEQLRLITSREWVYKDLRQLRDQIALEPTNGYLKFQFGQRLSMIGHWDDAVRAFEQARANGFLMADLWVDLGQAYVALGRSIQGMAAFRQAIRVNPTEVAAYAHLGQLLTESGRFREAVGIFRQALSMPNDDMASLYCGLGTALNGLRRWDEARRAFQQAFALESRLPEAAVGLATVSWRQGDQDAAWKYCRQALDQSPQMVPALILAVNIAVSQGDIPVAADLVLRAFQANTEDERLAYVLWTLATHTAHHAECTAAQLWQTHEHVVEMARRLVLDRVRTRRTLLNLQRDLSEALREACPLAEEAAEVLYQKLVGSPREVLVSLYDDLRDPGLIPPVERLTRAAELSRVHEQEWLAELCTAYTSVLSGTPEAPRLEVLLRALGRLVPLGVGHADALLDMYRFCMNGLAAESVEEMLALSPHLYRVALATNKAEFVVPNVGPFLISLSAWLDRVGRAAHSTIPSDEWAEIAEGGLELRTQLLEDIAPPELWALASVLTHFATLARQHVPTM